MSSDTRPFVLHDENLDPMYLDNKSEPPVFDSKTPGRAAQKAILRVFKTTGDYGVGDEIKIVLFDKRKNKYIRFGGYVTNETESIVKGGKTLEFNYKVVITKKDKLVG